MAVGDKKISGLDPAGTLDGTEPVAIVQGGDTVAATVQGIADMASGENLGNANLEADANRTYDLNGSLSTDTLKIRTASTSDIVQFRGDGTFFNKSVGFGAAPQSSYAGYFVSNGLSGAINIAGNAALGLTSATSNTNGVALRAVPTGTGAPVGVLSQITSNAGNKITFKSVITGTATVNVGLSCDVQGGTNNFAIDIVNGDIRVPSGGVGISETLTFGGGTTGDVSSLTVEKGVIISRVLVP